MRNQDQVVELRGHHLLCLQGFQGDGYSPEFVANMARLLDKLANSPQSAIRLVEGGDDLCRACPHWWVDTCQQYDSAVLARQDIEVLAVLDLRPGEFSDWCNILRRIGRTVDPVKLGQICGECPWLSQGCCEEGLAKLKAVMV
ncbi:MAG: DUF1284 domain-containing protein [Chloroflexi bacterium]|nr:DUF1284 domain-containing protein [Chloroflexota bacterium]